MDKKTALKLILSNRRFIFKVARQHFKNTIRVRLFGSRLIDPLAAVLYITHRCNLGCFYCTQRQPLVESQELSTTATLRLLGIIRREADTVFFTGGEPLMREDIDEIIARSKMELRFDSVLLGTNGTLLGGHEGILDHVSDIIVSLDSMKYGRLDATGKGDSELAGAIVGNIKRFSAMGRRKRCQVTVNCVISERNMDEVRSIMDFCFANGCIFSPVSALNENLPDPALLELDQYRQLVEYIIECKHRGLPIIGSPESIRCLLTFGHFRCYPTFFPRVYPNGDVFYPCEPKKTFGGNLFDAGSFKELFKRARKLHGEIPLCQGRCHLYGYVISSFYVHDIWNLARYSV